MRSLSGQEQLGLVEPPAKALLQELKARLQDLYGDRLGSLVLYGSHARGAARPDSDVDVAMVLDGAQRPWPEIDRTGPLVAELSLRYGVTVSLILIRKSDWDSNGTLLARSLHREGILVG